MRGAPIAAAPSLLLSPCCAWVLCCARAATNQARHKMAQHLANRELTVHGNAACIVDRDDVEFIVTELWHAKCAATGERCEG